MAAAMVEKPRRSPQTEGVVVRHQRRCPAGRGDHPCSCRPSFQAQVWAVRDRKTIRKTFSTPGEAQAWREEARVAIRRGELQAPSPITVGEAAEEWLERASAGVIRTRSGDPYKPAALRAYRHALDCRILPHFGQTRLTALTSNMLQDFADDFLTAGHAPSTIRNALSVPETRSPCKVNM